MDELSVIIYLTEISLIRPFFVPTVYCHVDEEKLMSNGSDLGRLIGWLGRRNNDETRNGMPAGRLCWLCSGILCSAETCLLTLAQLNH